LVKWAFFGTDSPVAKCPLPPEAQIGIGDKRTQILAALLKKPMFAVYFTFDDVNIGLSSLI